MKTYDSHLSLDALPDDLRTSLLVILAAGGVPDALARGIAALLSAAGYPAFGLAGGPLHSPPDEDRNFAMFEHRLGKSSVTSQKQVLDWARQGYGIVASKASEVRTDQARLPVLYLVNRVFDSRADRAYTP